MTAPLPLTPLEVASGLILGQDKTAPQLPDVDRTLSPLQALGEAMLPALERPPCLVSFSGGRDSSAVLATAARVARRQGFELPIPVTLRFPDAPESEESEWQEQVVRHLGLENWHRRTLYDELDFVGPMAQAVLRRHGLLWPANAHLHLPMLEEASGGSLLTGFDGDGLLAWWPWARTMAVVSGRERPVPRDLLRIGLALAPAAVRARRLRARDSLEAGWLLPAARKAVEDALHRESALEPRRWDRRIEAWRRARYLSVACSSFQALADEVGVRLVHPLLDRKFLAALTRKGHWHGFGDRTGAMRALFHDLLPAAILERTHKASFDGAFWGPHAREFADRWPGGGTPDALVDEDALRGEWRAELPSSLSATLLQATWLAGAPDEESAHGRITAPSA